MQYRPGTSEAERRGAATRELSRPSGILQADLMQTIDGQPVYSATDLVGYLACEHLTELERAALDGLVDRPMRVDPELDVIRRRGFQHEARYLAELTAAGKTVVTVDPDAYPDETPGGRLRMAAQATVTAMEAGADVIYQATFFDGRWRGHADFLLKVETRPSTFGPFHYEVADTKLARHVKASALLQICTYVDLLTPIQGVQPEWMHVALGGSAHAVERFRVDDYMAYYRAARDRFEAAVGADADPPSYPSRHTYPDPVEHCDVCRWSERCTIRRRTDDHLSLVAGISGRQRRTLGQRGVTTLEALGDLTLPLEPPLEGTSASALARVQDQARIQLLGRRRGSLEYELLRVEPERGLATLPTPSRGDLFFDMEGDPYAFDDGLDYLLGVMESDGTWHVFWSFDDTGEISLAGEKRAFEAFIDFVITRLAADPQLHIYHYAAYEPTAMKRLMGRHATREEEVDRLLRGGVFVDLLRAARQGLRASVESYSIKKMEPFYGFTREIDLRDAGSSIVAFEDWLELGEGERPSSDILERIERYNRDDVASNARLRDWLEGLRLNAEQLFGDPVPRPGHRSPDAPEGLTEAGARVQALTDRLTADVPADPADRTHVQAARWLLAQLLSWHRREMKAAYWDFFRRMGLTPEELVQENEALGSLEAAGPLGPAARRTPHSGLRRTWRYRIPAQEHEISSRAELYDPALQQERPDARWSDWKLKAQIVEIDDATGTIDLSWPEEVDPRHPQAIVPLDIINDQDLRAAIFRLGEWVAEHGVDAPGPWRAARDLLLRRAPRCGQGEGEELRRLGEADLDAARRLVSCLDQGTLAIQGPPGSGKTYTGARMIARLLEDGKRVGISANSHKVISHFLEKVVEATAEVGVELRAAQKVSEEAQGLDDAHVTVTMDSAKLRDGVANGDYNLAAGTAWLWASERSEQLVDVLFVDEAGQIALANVLAMSGATSSLVLLGDPQQLDQPLQGSHPPGADRSALAHLLGEHATMPPERGLFLETTWRLHPDICAFTSESFYDERLVPEPDLVRQRLSAVALVDGTGLRMLEVQHEGNDNQSPDEALQVAALALALVEGGGSWIDRHDQEHPIGWNHVLVITPYNAQVGAIAALLPDAARVGTVDKFQGQEAPISIYSMATSSPEDAPRGMDFLYSRHRLNVATSRARCVAVVVASPALLRVRARTPEQMRLANALCRFVERAREPGAS
jgi:predicted RecB family nuclease